MKKFVFIIFLATLIFKFTSAQESNALELAQPKYEQLFKTIPLISNNSPKWVKLLYAKEPNFYVIQKAYDNYYLNNIFTKNTHTQNFKYFTKLIYNNDYLLDDGTIYIPTLLENEQKKAKLLELKIAKKKALPTSKWEPIGPFITYDTGGVKQKSDQANIYSLDQSISNPNVLFAGGEVGAVFKSTDKGLNWTPTGENIFGGDNLNIGVVKIDPTNENVVYVGTGNKLFKTSDGGATWKEKLAKNNLFLLSISINPNNSNIILVGGNSGLSRSIDGGNTWSEIYTDRCWDIRLKTDDPNTVFLTKHNNTKNITEFLKSSDNGQTFTVKDNGWFSPINGKAKKDGGARIGVTNIDPNRIYVILLGEEEDAIADNNYIGIYRSDDAGESWTTPYDGNKDGIPDNEPGGPYSNDHWCLTGFNTTKTGYDQGFYNLDIEVSDTNPDSFLVGALNLFKSEDGGKSYVTWGGYMCQNCTSHYRHPDIQEIIINNGDIWVSTDGGIDYYDDKLNFIESRNRGLNGSEYWGFDQGWNENVLVGGRYHNGNAAHHQNYGLGKFLSLGGGESRTGYVDKGMNRKVFHQDIGAYEIPETLTGKIKKVSNLSIYPNERYANGSEIVIDPRYWNVIYLGKNHKLWKSNNGGKSFSLVKEFGSDGTNIVQGIEVSRQDPNIILLVQKVGSSGVLWKSLNGGINWTKVMIPDNSTGMTLSLNIEHELYLTLDKGGNNTNKVFKSNDLGVSWINLTSPTLNGERILFSQVQEGTNGGFYIASNKRVWYRNNTHADWQSFSNNFPKSLRITKMLAFYKEGKLRLAGNRGVWENDFFETSLPKAQPMVSSKTTNCSKEFIQFEDYSILNHNTAQWKWEFPGSTTVSSYTIRNPKVIYSTPGMYDVTLTITDKNNNSDTKTITQMVNAGINNCLPEERPQQALELATIEQYASNTTIKKSNINNFSFTGWIKPSGIQADYSAIFCLSSGQGNENNALNFKNSNNTLGFHWNGKYYSHNSQLIVPKDQWSYVAITVTPTLVTLYMNEKKASFNVSTVPFELNSIKMGRYYNTSERTFKGLIEEATFWTRALTDDEIKLSRHLTKSNLSDVDLIAYYQFNHLNEGKIYDKKESNDLFTNGAPSLVASDAPIGPGKSNILNVNSGGIKIFQDANLSIKFPATGTYPDGDVVVSKINIDPSISPTTNTIDHSYWIINNYGSNEVFSPLEELTFSEIKNLATLSPSNIFMYKRASNSSVAIDWDDLGISATKIDAPSKSAIFTNTGGITSFSQFYLGSNKTLGIEDIITENSFLVYPNPISNGEKLNFNKKLANAKFILYDTSGQEVIKGQINNQKGIIISNKLIGVYFYSIESENKIYTGKLIVK